MTTSTNKPIDILNRDKSYSIDSTSHNIDSDSTQSSRNSSFELYFAVEDASNNIIDIYEKLKIDDIKSNIKSNIKSDNKSIPETIKYIKRRKREQNCNSIVAYSPPDMNEYFHNLMINTNKHK